MRCLYLSLTPNMRIDDWSGWGTHMRGVVSALEDHGHAVELSVAGGGRLTAAPGASSTPSGTAVPKRHGFLRGPVRHLLRDLYELDHDRRAAAALDRVLVERSIDAVYERSAMMQISGVAAAARHGLPHVLEVNTPLEERRDHHGFPLYAVGVRRERRKIALADQIVCVSSPLKRYLVELGASPDQVHVIPNAVRPESFARDPGGRAALRARWGMGKDEVAVGFVGRFGFWRGMGELVQAFASAIEAEPRVRGVLIGDGQRMDDVRDAIRAHGIGDRIELTGAVDWREVATYVGALDVGVLLGSPWYSSPLKLFEYGAAGLAVVAPRTEPVEEVLDDGVEGILIPPDDAESMAAAIVELAADRERRVAIAERFRARVLASHTWAGVGARITALVESSPRRASESGRPT